MSLTETMRAVDQLGIAFWFAYRTNGPRYSDPAALQQTFLQAITYGIQVGLTAEQVADAAFYGRRSAIAGNTPSCLAGRSFQEFASDVAACVETKGGVGD